ncbi:MAG TPA: RluA family pseudouridine synthase [Deltaproteobacteria bacterium]|nr:RluA family pseudouridine synthase [Deltaproteobacteria bacterium]
MIIRKTVENGFGCGRLDDALAQHFEAVSKSEARRIIDRGGCAVNSAMVRVASRMVRGGDVIEIGLMERGRFQELLLPPEALLYEDRQMLAVNKPSGINAQRTPYQLKGTLEYWVGEYFRSLGLNEPARIVHRLDRGTSGVMLFPKNKPAAAWISRCFHDGLISKCYLALVRGTPDQPEWSVDGAIGKIGSARYGIMAAGRPALTCFRILSCGCGHTLVEARPQTGRTHQIRVHLESCGLPIVGDATYGGEPYERMLLHCSMLSFKDQAGHEVSIRAGVDALFDEYLTGSGLQLPG